MHTDEILTCLQKEIHTVILATVDEQGMPVTCAIDLMLLDQQRLYFLTAKGKPLYQRLLQHPVIALTGLKGTGTLSSIAISLQGKVRPIGQHRLADIFQENPYMAEIYPHSLSREALAVFELATFQGEYFDLSQKPVYRCHFAVNQPLQTIGYVIGQNCDGCQRCKEVCPQNCIVLTAIPGMILQNHCLACGRCQEVCPKQAIVRGKTDVVE